MINQLKKVTKSVEWQLKVIIKMLYQQDKWLIII